MNVLFLGDSCKDVFIHGRLGRPMNGFQILQSTSPQASRFGMVFNIVDLWRILGDVYSFSFSPTVLTRTNCEKQYFVDQYSRIIFRNDPNFIPEPLEFPPPKIVEPFDLGFVIDYNKGVITPSLLKWAFESCSTIILTTKSSTTIDFILPTLEQVPSPPDLYIALNQLEYVELSNDQRHFLRIVEMCKSLLVTKGKLGTDLYSVEQQSLVHSPVPTLPVENPIDATCAGDVFLSAFGFYLFYYQPIKPAHTLLWLATNSAMRWAGESTKHLGMWLPTKEQAEDFVQENRLI